MTKLHKLDRLILSNITKEGTTSRFIRNSLVNTVSNADITKAINKLLSANKIKEKHGEANESVNGISYILIDL